MPSNILGALQKQAEAAANAYLDYRVGGINLEGISGVVSDPSSLQDMAAGMNLNGLLNLASLAIVGTSFTKASGANLSALSAVDLAMSLKLYADQVEEGMEEMAALKRFALLSQANRSEAFEKSGLKNLLNQRASDKKPKKGFIPDQEVDKELKEEPVKENEVAPEEEAPTPGGKAIKPAATPPSGGPTLEGTPDTTDIEEGKSVGGDDENETARQLAQEKRDSSRDGSGDQKAEKEGSDREGSDIQASEKEQIDGQEEGKIAQRQLAEKQRVEALRGKKDEQGIEGIKEKMEDSWYGAMVRSMEEGPIPGNLLYFWIAFSALIVELPALLVGEIYIFSINFGFIHLHALISLLPFKVVIPWKDGKLKFDRISWREWMAIGLLDMFFIAIVLLAFVLVAAVVRMAYYPIELLGLGFDASVVNEIKKFKL